jgi:hypothetical protein
MKSKIKEFWKSFIAARDIHSPLQASSAAQHPETYYHTLRTLPYASFLEIILNTGTLDLLVRAGNPDAAVVIQVWESILGEYYEVIKTDKSDNIFFVYKKIKHLEWKLTIISNSLEYLKHVWSADIANLLLELGYDYVQDLPDREQYLKQVYGIETEAKFLVVQLNQYNNEYQVLCPAGSNNTQRTYMDYAKEMQILSKFMGYRIDPHVVTVYEFCTIVNLYIDHHRKSHK